MINLKNSIIICTIMFLLGTSSLIIRKNLFFILMGIEIMLNSTGLLLIIANHYLDKNEGQIIYMMLMSISASESSICLALLIKLYNLKKTLNIDVLNEIK
ncbi:NADH-quinone oxidoreductase subunit K [Candidatus Annandia adelgestsuga]|uniref:NADH-quinone oxidoreductase subunit K n=1 Tax=Candidatus Annandia adelgestsuga TaxID=1302411 RepID=A0A3S9J7H4_9ENTR|nr:NADH-quinone oxidoreductase subunit NuoK [Candidatus Annandia adelgestsuga]AZP36321.1 NADH-quinone oxidoreductase subunit K [Candidatus Annandia adelgestsuga]